MNLVQINERLKNLPMQVLQQYANGMNPEVPPYLALGELQRREMSQKQAATAQGGQQGPQPSVKEQVEQKAGLMALQQMQQQQAAQQMQQPRGPMPAPAGTPQPQMQPQPQQPPAMMARGGLAGIPVRRDMFEYAGGGIIAFQSGGQSLNERAARQMEEKGSIYDPFFGLPAEERERMKQEAKLKAAQDRASQGTAVTESNAQAMMEGARSRVNELESNREELVRKFGPRMYEQALSKAKQEIDAASSRGSELMAKQSQMGQERVAAATPPPAPLVTSQGPGMPVVPRRPIEPASGIAAALPKAGPAATERPAPPMAGPATPPMPGAPRPAASAQAAPASGLPAAAQGASPLLAEAATMAREKPAAPTPEGIIQEQNKLLPAGLQEAAQKRMFDEQRARAEGRQAAYEKSKPSGLDDLIRVFGQAGQYKGMSGLAPAETALQQQRRSEDLAMQKQQDELLTAIEGRKTAADEKLFGARKESMTAAQKSYQDRLMTNTKTLADLAGVDQRRIDEAAQRLTQMQVAKLQAATAARPSETERIESKYMGLLAQGKIREAEDYLNTISKIKGGGAAGFGADKQELAELKTLLKNAEETASNFALPKATRDEAARRMTEINNQIASMTKLGSGSTSPAPAGKVPPPPPGFKVN